MDLSSHLAKNSIALLKFTGMFLAIMATLTQSTIVIANEINHLPIHVTYVTQKIVIDGQPNDADWQHAEWLPLDKHILGIQPEANDFSGQYKLLWHENKLYLLAEIIDDVIFDKTADPTVLYWDDDCLEIFIDEDASGGEHQFSHNAFAYHVALDHQVVDYSVEKTAKTYNDHVQTQWRRNENDPRKIYWELAINIYPDSYKDNLSAKDKNQVSPVTLHANKLMGFMLAYCDNDGSEQRESFIGSHEIAAKDGDKNRGYKDADVFGKIILIK